MTQRVNIRELSRHTSKVIEDAASQGRAVAITNHGRVVAVLQAVDEDVVLAQLLDTQPDLTERIARAREDVAAGRTMTAREVEAELAAERGGGTATATSA